MALAEAEQLKKERKENGGAVKEEHNEASNVIYFLLGHGIVRRSLSSMS